MAGKLDPTLRSGAGADEKWLQASHWQEQLQQNSQNMKFTLVAFTARWCGFCKSVPPLVRIIDEVQCVAQFSPLHLVTPPQILSQEALPVDVKLFDVDVNDAAVADAHVNVTSVPTLILIPPVLTPQGFSNVYSTPIESHKSFPFFVLAACTHSLVAPSSPPLCALTPTQIHWPSRRPRLSGFCEKGSHAAAGAASALRNTKIESALKIHLCIDIVLK